MKANYSNMAKKRAIALKYNGNDDAPTIVATGVGDVADKIINTAIENNVEIEENDTLASTLGRLDLGSEVPEALYDVVAEILLFIGEMDSKRSLLRAKLMEN